MRWTRIVAVLLFLLPRTAHAQGLWSYAVVGANPDPWQKLLEASGFAQAAFEDARVVVVRPGAADGAIDWAALARGGKFLIIEGNAAAGGQWGITQSGENAPARREVYPSDPQLMVIWEQAMNLPVYRLPPQATVYSKERWSNAPLMAGFKLGGGAVLWVAADPGPGGYERFPYLVRALRDLGMELPFASRRIWAFFDYAYRTRADFDYLAQKWRSTGLAGLYISGWYFMERDPVRDASLRNLISACHRNGILTYLWLELPHISEQFWNDHPAWRDKTALLQDAAIYWRKDMNLLNRDASRASAALIHDAAMAFEWDGINLGELYFEGPSGVGNLSEFTPFNDDVRREVKQQYGFDAADLFSPSSPFYYTSNPDKLRLYLDYRIDLQYRLHLEWIGRFVGYRAEKPYMGLTVTYLDDLFDTRFHDNVGADSARVLKLLDQYYFEFMGEDPSAIWNLGPERYQEMSRLYSQYTTRKNQLALDINIVPRDNTSYPSLIQTGSEVMRLMHTGSASFQKVALYSEVSILDQDIPFVSGSSAIVERVWQDASGLHIRSPYGAGVRFNSSAMVDGKVWPFTDGTYVWLPAGDHVISGPAQQAPLIRLLDFNGNLLDASVADATLKFRYNQTARAIAVVDRQPKIIRVDGVDSNIAWQEYKGRYSMMLPPGDHGVEITAYTVAGNPAANFNGLVSGATFAAGVPVSPGSIVSLFGSNLATSEAGATSLPLPLRLGEALVRVNGAAAPLLYVSPTQINFQVPWSLSGWLQAPLTVSVAGATSASQNVTLAAFSPGIFTVDQSGKGQGAILLANSNTVADAAHPVKRGDYISIFCTGLGPVSNAPATGSPALSSPLSTTLTAPAVTIGGANAQVTFSGLAPGFVGLYQVNAQVPPEAAPGNAVPVSISIGGVSSNTVTIAVQ